MNPESPAPRRITETDQPQFPCELQSRKTGEWEVRSAYDYDFSILSSYFSHWRPLPPSSPQAALGVREDKILGTGFYRDAAPGMFGRSEWLDLLMACQDGRATCMRVLEIIERETVPARLTDGAALVEAMTNAFLRWPLPKSVRSDLCVTMPDYPNERPGTCLLTYPEAKQMIQDVVLPLLAAPVPAGGETKCADCGCALNAGEAATFTVCDKCWDKKHPATPPTQPWAVSASKEISQLCFIGQSAPEFAKEVLSIILQFAPPDLTAEVARLQKAKIDACIAWTEVCDQLRAAQAENEKLVKEREDARSNINQQARELYSREWDVFVEVRAERDALKSCLAQLEAALPGVVATLTEIDTILESEDTMISLTLQYRMREYATQLRALLSGKEGV